MDVTPQDYKVTLLCNSDDSRTPVGSDQLSSEEDHPLSSGQDDQRKVCKRNNRPLCQSDSMDRPANEPVKVETSVDMGNDSLMNKQDSEGAASGQIHDTMGLWRPPSGPGAPGLVPTSSCASCMRCDYCFPRSEPPVQ